MLVIIMIPTFIKVQTEFMTGVYLKKVISHCPVQLWTSMYACANTHTHTHAVNMIRVIHS